MDPSDSGDLPKDVHVGSGAFRVDRRRALEKLMRFQMPDAHLFLLPWVRAAVASGATRVWVSHEREGLEFCFDGLPWTAEELADPYRALFAEEEEARSRARNRELAIGILTALRLQLPPKAIAIQFWDKGVSRVLRVDDVFRETLSEIPAAVVPEDLAPEGRIRMRIRVLRPGRYTASIGHLEKGCRRAPLRLEIDGKPVANDSEPPRDYETEFEEGPLRGRLWISPRSFAESRIEWVVLGTTVCVDKTVLPGVQMSATLAHDGLSKTASQTAIARDGIYRECLAALGRRGDALLERLRAEFEFNGASLLRALRSPEYRRGWMPWEEQTTGESVLSGLLDMKEMAGDFIPGKAAESVSADRKMRETVRRASLAVAAVRAAALVHRVDMESGSEGSYAELWESPVGLNAEGKPVSLRELDDQRRWLGFVPFTDATAPEPVEGIVSAWVPRETDLRFYESFFSGNVRPASAVKTEDLPSAPSRPSLSDSNLLIRIPFSRGRATGEFGLSLSPHPRHSRIRWMRSGHSYGTSVWSLGGLRLEAAIDDPAIRSAPNPGRVDGPVMRVIADLLERSVEAYRRLGEEYDPEDPGPRDAIIREHLLDLVCEAWDGTAERWKSHDWLDGVALFRERGGAMVSMRRIREAAATRTPLSLFESPHPESQLEMTQGYPNHVPRIFAGSTRIKRILPMRQDGASDGGGAEVPVVRPVPEVRVGPPPEKSSAAPEPSREGGASGPGAPAPSSGLGPARAQSPAMTLRESLMAWARAAYGKRDSAMLLRAARILESREAIEALEGSRFLEILEGFRQPDALRGYLLATAFSAMRRKARGRLTDAEEAAFLEVLLSQETDGP
jgi:hypothetical protein